MQRKIKKIGTDFQLEEHEESQQIEKKIVRKSSWEGINYLSLGWYFVTPILLGVIIGLYLDSVFHTKPIFILSLIFFGFVASIYNLWKFTKEQR